MAQNGYRAIMPRQSLQRAMGHENVTENPWRIGRRLTYTAYMKTVRWTIIAAFVAAGCASPKYRIRRHQAAFDSYPPAVQKEIREGQVEVGFTPEQVEMALGRPDRRYDRKTAAAAQDVWAYGGSVSPRLGLGFGMGSGGVGGGLGVDTGVDTGFGGDERVRVVFQNGVVVSVESRKN